MHRGLRYLSRQAFEILPPTPAERHCVLHLHISHNTTWFLGGKARCIMGDMQMKNARFGYRGNSRSDTKTVGTCYKKILT